LKPKQTVFRLTLRSNPRQIMRVEPFLKKIGHGVHLDEIQLHKLMVSLTEAVNNAIIHGNKLQADKRVKVRCEIMPGWLVLTVADEGKGFDPGQIGNPLRKKNLLKESGRGVFLMRTLMDKVVIDGEPYGSEIQLWLDLNK
jgi:serine/threonine-protein kinase RsbW